ncbi:hypothetical protein K469DRAFT_698161 [Zopfia rhizophila CBS 207.26]|uniref:Uncharacterized protein n=1 Tax=Zopfia rhizophila CBS 207.26 TaxID=1314779 RepID=A0A6A6DBI4_9PEZI|nr:hypothetical protein K469DRAFT_698161 [Zopfia rhizophila CBS 207.26]
MQSLNYAARAAQFWGVIEQKPSMELGQYSDYANLQEAQDRLDSGRRNWMKHEDVRAMPVFRSKDLDHIPWEGACQAHQVRFCVIGADIKSDSSTRQLIIVDIQHTVSDTFLDSNGKQFNFEHDVLKMPFQYNTSKIKAFADCTSDVGTMTDGMGGDFTGVERIP